MNCFLGVVWACAVAQSCSSDNATPPAAGSGGTVSPAGSGGTASPAGSGAVSAPVTPSATGFVAGWNPPAATTGYTRLAVPMVKGVGAGSDISYCQYIQGPLDHDVDVLDVQGSQSPGGHHAVAYASTSTAPVGASRLCTEEDNVSQGGFLGGIGGEGSGGVKLPDGVAFRLPKGSSVMLNTHFVNTTDNMLDGQTAIDFKFVEVDGKRVIASLFSNGNVSFNLPAHAKNTLTAECTLPRDFKFILFSNHMHDHGSYAKTEVVHADGSVDLVHEDPTWTWEMQFNAVYSKWTLDKPLVVAKGDRLRTQCDWENTGATALTFPSEMCFGIGFFLSDGSSSPVCLEGKWLER
ncbi:MAG: hypothetical protein RL701_5702 [Pseudomonadota bacterium]